MPDESAPTPEPSAGKYIDLKGAQVSDQRSVGPLGGVLVVKRPESLPPDAWSGCDHIILRVLVPEADESEETIARLREDVEALVGVEHPGLYRVLGIAKHKDNEFIAIESPSGETLQSMIARREPPPDKALKMGSAIAAALGELAKAGRPHRDFTPSAVFVAKDGTPRVVPVACPRDFRVEPRVSPVGSYRGEPLYAAPELHEGGGLEPTQRSNIFAFGVAFYEMLTYQAPFRGGTPTRTLADVAENDPRPPSSVVSGLPPEIDTICLRCLDKDPERRYPGFAAIVSTLRIAAESLALGKGTGSGRIQSTRELAAAEPPVSQSTRGMPVASAGVPARSGAGKKGLVIAAAAVVVAALGLVALVISRAGPPAPKSDGIAENVFRQAAELIDEGRFEKARRLLDSHRERIRSSSPGRFDAMLSEALVADLVRQGKAAQEEGRWEDAVRAFETALAESKGPEDVALRGRLDESLYRAELDRAETAERADDWAGVSKAIEKAISLGRKRGVPESELESFAEDVAFARAMVEAGAAKSAGDEVAEIEGLFVAEELRRGDRAVMERLAELGAGPAAATDALARSRKAFEAGERAEAERLAKKAGRLWPRDERPAQVLGYFADRSYCEMNDSVFVSPTGPWRSWGPAERAKAFCVDPYEFRNEEERLPRTRISGIEAAAACRKRGGRLCRVAEWQLACSGTEGRVFPYGNTYAFDACNTAANGPASPGTARNCRSPFGAHDMSGNVAEWTAEFVRGRGQVVAGGDWSSGEAGSTCKSVIYFAPKLVSPRVGFRCCRSIPGAGEDAK